MTKTPEKLGDYELVRRISDGAQASVYLARHCITGEEYALKLFKNSGEDDDSEMRFRREAEMLEKLSHRNIVRYKDAFTATGEWDEPQNCLAMEFMEGQTLKDYMKSYPKGMKWEDARDILEQCIAGLQYAHEKFGITHRDIKPSNIFILADGHVRLFDFGIARMEGSATKTGGGACMGSFDFMAPDFALAEEFTQPGEDPFRGDILSDIFSLTLCFYEMLTGRLPWRKYGERPELEYLARWRKDKPKNPSHSPIVFRVVRHLTGFIDTGLNPDRSKRYQSLAELRDAMHSLRTRIIRHKGRDEYDLTEGLDKGGFGEVYLAKRKSDNKVLAIKRLFSDRASRRFIKEAEILKRYKHPHLVEYTDFFQNQSTSGSKQLFIVMEYLAGMPGWSLKNRIKDAPTGIEPDNVLEYFRYYLEALQYLHENVNQIIHRDIKPANLYAPVDCNLNAKILDLGVARDVSGTQTHGATPGTWDFMAPEFVTENCRGTPQSDIYALGLSMYEALTGQPAFPRVSKSGQEAAAEFLARATGAKKVQMSFDHAVFKEHPELIKVVKSSTHSNPKKRYTSAAQMRIEIMLVLKSMGKLGDEEMDDFADAGSSATHLETGGTPGMTAATMIAPGGTEPSQEWQRWVTKEKRRRTTRKIITAATAGLTFLLGVMVIGLLVKRATPDTPPDLPQPMVPEAPDIIDPDTSNPGETTEITRTAVTVPDPKPEPVAVKAKPEVKTKTKPKPAESLWSKLLPQDTEKAEDAASVKELAKDLRLLRIRGIVSTSHRAFFEDAAARTDNADLLISQPEYKSIRQNPAIISEQKRLWHHIADNAVARYRTTSDARFLTAARGALHAAASLYGNTRSSELYARVLKEWTGLSVNIDFESFLPIPQIGKMSVKKNSGKPVQNKYLVSLFRSKQYSKSFAGMLPHSMNLKISARFGHNRIRECELDFALVPEDTAKKGGEPQHPFYIATTETTFGAMRCYRDGAVADARAKPRLARRFTGKLGQRSLQDNSRPYRLGNESVAFEFCNWLSYRNGLSPVYSHDSMDGHWVADFNADGFRLPTPAEWEYAARFGIDWQPVKGTASWKDIKKSLSAAPTDDLVWFYYKKTARSTTAKGSTPYPLGMVDMCGNLGELAMNHGTVSVCGGSYASRTSGKVMPWSRAEFDDDDPVGFRVILPVKVADFIQD